MREQKWIEEALKESEERYRAVVEQSAEAIYLYDAETKRVLESNAAFRKLMGYSEEELSGMRIYDFIDQDDDIDRHVQRSLEEGRRHIGERRYRRKDGSVIVVDTSASVISYNGKIALCAVSRDVTERKRAEEEIRKLSRYNRNLFEANLAALMTLDLEGKITDVNKATEEIIGVSKKDLVGTEVFSYFTDPRRAREWFGRALREGALRGYELEIRNSEGSLTPVSYNVTVYRDENGRVAGVLASARDITERKQREKKLRDLRREYEELVDSVEAIIWRGDAQTLQFTFVSHQAESILGYPTERWTQEPSFWPDHIHPEDRQWALSFCKAATAEKRSHTFEYRMIASDGRVVWFRDIVHVATEKDVATQLFGVMIDITEQKRAEETLKENEERFRSLIQYASDIITILEADGTVRYDSPAVERMLGYEPEARVGTSAFDYIHPDDVGRVRRSLAAALEDPGGVQPPIEFRLRHRDGSWRYVEVTRSNLLDYPAVRGVVANTRDITERKAYEEALRKSEAKFRAVFDRAAIGMALVDAEGRLMEGNPALQEMLGYDGDELRGMHFADVTHPDDVAPDAELFEELVADKIDQFQLEKRYVRKDGSQIWGCLTSSSVHHVDDGPWFMIGMVEDITERKRAEEALRESEERYRAVVEQSVEAIYLFDPETKRVLESNAALQEMLGYTADELLDTDIYDFVAHERENIDWNVQRHLLEEKRFVGERKYRRKDGRLLEVEVSATMVPYRGGRAVCCVVRDVTARIALEDQLAHQAFHDSLTELPNRALFLDRLGHALARARRGEQEIAVLFVDLDDFKVVNDSLGHENGDRLLIEVGERLRSCVRPGDTVARLFGDEFAVLLETPASMDEARAIADRIIERLQAPFVLDAREVFASVSVGITDGGLARDEGPDEGRPEDVLRRADLAMYVAKRRGKNRCEVFSPSMNTRVLERMETENQLRRAVEHGEFTVYYQPIVDLNTGAMRGLEALARWRHPERGLIAAEDFAQIAEETGLIRPVGRRVFEEACRKAKEWRELHPDKPFLMSVNFSASQFSHQADVIPRVLNDIGLDPRILVIEITERAVMEDAEFALGKLRRMEALGVSFAIDDYGTGYSCLRYLKLMPVDSLKIDSSFIAGLGKDSGDTAIVSGTINLAHALGLKVIAEGVETAEQFRRLRELRCDLVQGYYLSEPLAGEEIQELLAGDLHRWPTW